MSLSRNMLLIGTEVPLPEPVLLRAGPLSLCFQDGELRHITLGDREIVNRIYVAVRSADWLSVPAVTTVLDQEISESSFQLLFENRHRDGPIDFSWRGCIQGRPNGRIHFTMDGLAHTSFLKNRIGFCVLHPALEFAGQSCTIEKTDGTLQQAVFPEEIAPHQPFLNVRAITCKAAPGVSVKVHCAGDIFETEDQRNWTDPSFKTYSTPLDSAHPIEILQGTAISQAITVSVDMDRPLAAIEATPASLNHRLSIGGPTHPAPLIGLCCSNPDVPLSPIGLKRLRSLLVSHLRVDVHSFAPAGFARLRCAVEEANQIDAALEIALFLSDNPETDLRALRNVLGELQPRVVRWLVFGGPFHTTGETDIRLARKWLADCSPAAKFTGGSDENFAELNRFPPPAGAFDSVTYSVNPQTHAHDHETLIESLPMQRETVRAARRLAKGLPVSVSPITLKSRYLSHERACSKSSDRLPHTVDVRQMTLFGAAWTVGSIKSVSDAGAESVTYYQTQGWRGVMESEAGSPLPEQFASIPGSVFPLFHVIADFCEFAGGQVIPTVSSRPREIEGLTLQKEGRTRVLVANLSARRQSVSIQGAPLSDRIHRRELQEETALFAMQMPEQFRGSSKFENLRIPQNMEITLFPFAVMTIDSA